MTGPIRETSGKPEDVARAFIRSCIEDIGPEQLPDGGREVLENALLTPVIIAMTLAMDGAIPFPITVNAMAAVLRYAGRLNPQLTSHKEGIQ